MDSNRLKEEGKQKINCTDQNKNFYLQNIGWIGPGHDSGENGNFGELISFFLGECHTTSNFKKVFV